MYYALTDTFAGNNPTEHTHGFANTKEVIAFDTRAARDKWLSETRLLSAKAVSRSEALKMTPWARGEHYGIREDQVKPVRIYSATNEAYHALAVKTLG